MPIRSIDTSGRTVHIAVADDLTAADLGLIGDALRQGARGATVTIDFRRARELSPARLVSLTGMLSALGVRYAFAGLSGSNERVLAYLGPEADREPSRGAGG